MSDDARQAYIRRIVDAAPPLSAEDAHRVRALVPLKSRLAAERSVSRPRPQSRRKTAA
ncbi:hypothetical protein PYK79_45130 [Streptomyces sp. ID05-04B]|uniref:hypothetical protein n=1 Tax=unclassified Streptomyces TaxID=2593676 RepID=UPI00131EFF0D|nr:MULTISPECIES: hypothetical protein [unclassified Streptomyces]MDX5569032.1 hypothetical protein [Streptomyces sp. ID05-04B]